MEWKSSAHQQPYLSWAPMSAPSWYFFVPAPRLAAAFPRPRPRRLPPALPTRASAAASAPSAPCATDTATEPSPEEFPAPEVADPVAPRSRSRSREREHTVLGGAAGSVRAGGPEGSASLLPESSWSLRGRPSSPGQGLTPSTKTPGAGGDGRTADGRFAGALCEVDGKGRPSGTPTTKGRGPPPAAA